MPICNNNACWGCGRASTAAGGLDDPAAEEAAAQHADPVAEEASRQHADPASSSSEDEGREMRNTGTQASHMYKFRAGILSLSRLVA